MLMCGKSSKFWNTMPMWARSFGRSVFGSPTETPFTRISPFWKGSSPLTVLMRVDLPDPEGPQTTTTSPFPTRVVQSVEHLERAVPLAHVAQVDHGHGGDSYRRDGEPRLQALHRVRGGEADDEEDDGDEDVELDDAAGELARPWRPRRGSP